MLASSRACALVRKRDEDSAGHPSQTLSEMAYLCSTAIRPVVAPIVPRATDSTGTRISLTQNARASRSSFSSSLIRLLRSACAVRVRW